MVTGYQKCVHVLVEPSLKCTSIFVLGNTSELRLGGSDVAVVLINLSGRDITIEPCTKIGMVTATNIVPSMQVEIKRKSAMYVISCRVCRCAWKIPAGK